MFKLLQTLLMFKTLNPATGQTTGKGLTPAKAFAYILIIVFVIIVMRRLIRKYKENKDVKELEKAEDKPIMELVHRFYAALHTGLWGASEDEDQVLEIAKEVEGRDNLKAINKTYKQKYGVYLIDEITRLLDSDEEIDTFYSNVDSY